MPNLIKKSWTVSNSKYSKYKKITFEEKANKLKAPTTHS